MRDYDSMKEKFLRKEEPIKVDQSLMTDFDTMEETAHVTEEQIIDIRGSGAFHKTIQSDSGNNTIQSDSGNNTIQSDSGNNTIQSDLGNNTIQSDSGNNTME